MRSALANARAQRTEAATDLIAGLLRFSAKVVDFVRSAGKVGTSASDDVVIDAYFGDTAGSALKSERTQLYRVFLLGVLGRADLEDAATDASQARLRGLLGLSDMEAAESYEEVTAPILRAKIEEVLSGGEKALTAKESDAIAAQERSLGLTAEVAARIRVDAYAERLEELAGDGKVPSEKDDSFLRSLRGFLKISQGAAEDVHARVCAPSYTASLREAMGTTGVITPQYWDGLKTLQKRLLLSDSAAEELFLLEAREALRKQGAKAYEAMTDALRAEQEKGKDAGDGGASPRRSPPHGRGSRGDVPLPCLSLPGARRQVRSRGWCGGSGDCRAGGLRRVGAAPREPA